jgi:hypothetical protein
MKNLHLLPTDKRSRLYIGDNLNFVFGMIQTSIQSRNDYFTNQHIYITSDEEIKEGDWVYDIFKNACPVIKQLKTEEEVLGVQETELKIILTTDQDLIKDGVQPIDYEFLEWFVKNPSCEEVEVANDLKYFNVDELRERHLKGLPHLYSESIGYKIIIPKKEHRILTVEAFNKAKISYKEPKQDEIMERFIANAKQQETLEEACNRIFRFPKDISKVMAKRRAIELAKWQQEQILDFLYSEITERRDYSASKMCEKVIEFIGNLKNK